MGRYQLGRLSSTAGRISGCDPCSLSGIRERLTARFCPRLSQSCRPDVMENPRRERSLAARHGGRSPRQHSLGAVVVRIAQTATNVEGTYTNAGSHHTLVADHMIWTLPFTVL